MLTTSSTGCPVDAEKPVDEVVGMERRSGLYSLFSNINK